MNQTSDSPDTLYEERNRRLLDQVALRQTEQVPFVFGPRFWTAKLAGISFEEQMYDADKAAAAFEKAVLWLEPDGYTPTLNTYGPTLEALDYRLFRWPGHGTDANATFQYLEMHGVVEEPRAGGTPYVFIPLHWGLDGFMSPEQFDVFYWPALRKYRLS